MESLNLNYASDLYCMDNLELLKQIKDSSIDLIYCDILYNTGKKFKDYNDKLGTPQQAMDWYRPRLIQMWRILKNTGCIYLQCDYRLVHYLKVEMDNLFGESSFRNHIIWDYNRWTGLSNTRFQNMHDDLLFYAKPDNKLNHLKEPIDKPKLYQNRKDKNGDYIRNEDGTVKYFPQYDRFIDDVWHIDILNPRAKERVGYDTQKPKKLLERIILSSSNEGDIVADFFCGSGTSLVVAKELNRKYIGCDINPKAIDITNKRLNNT